MNTIYDGSFVLGQTSAENPSLLVNENSEGNVSILQGTVATSAGIVGDGSTQNPLRADETVLFETTALDVSAVSLPEPLSAFERFRIYPYQANVGYFNYGEFDYDITLSLSTGNNIRLLYNRSIGGNNPFQFMYCAYTLSNDTKSITAVSGVRRWFPAGSGAGATDTDKTYIRKIVGINHKA